MMAVGMADGAENLKSNMCVAQEINLKKYQESFVKNFRIMSECVDEQSKIYQTPEFFVDYLHRMFKYAMLDGKMTRGCLVVFVMRFIKKSELTEQEELLANVLGWCVELLQGLFLILDDIMDKSLMRRGKPCWYKVKGVGLSSINDSVICNAFIYKMIVKYFKDNPYYTKILELFFDVTLMTGYGQGIDMQTSPEGENNFDQFTEERYNYITEYKTSYYSFYLPFSLAMHLSNITKEETFCKVKRLLVEIGRYYQVQDDFIDCYGDSQKTGKIGTDIQDNKCSWLIVQALKHCSKEQRKILEENYGEPHAGAVEQVLKVYNDLNMKEKYEVFEREKIVTINSLVNEFDDSEFPREAFFHTMKIISKRNT